MNKFKISILLSAACLLPLTSCFKEEDDFFEESSAQRLNHSMEEYHNAIISAENGWVLQYFANTGEQGYPLLVKFSEDGSVTMAANNNYSSGNQYKEERSLYEVIGDDGPVLSFNSYNSLLHVFSNPVDIPDTSDEDEDGVGHEGDYEFRFISMSADGNTIYMKGKKYNLDIRLTRLSDTQNWEAYYTDLAAVKSAHFPSVVKKIWLDADGERYSITGMSNGLMEFVPEGGDPIAETTKLSYIVYLDGSVHLCEPFKGDDENFEVQDFALNEEGILVCTNEGQNAVISAGDMPTYLVDNTWRMDKNATTGGIIDAYNALVGEFRAAGYGSIQYVEFAYDSDLESFTLFFRSTSFNAKYCVNVEKSGESATLAFNREATQAAADGGDSDAANGLVFYDSLTSIPAFVSAVMKPYTITANSPLGTTTLTLTDASGNVLTLSLR